MRLLPETIQGWVLQGDSVALATVVETKKSAPQPVGTKMAINGSQQVCGSVSGGCVEGAVIEAAERVLAGADAHLLQYGIADEEAWDVGLPCGGEISVWVERYDPGGLQGRFTELDRDGARAALVTAISGNAEPGAKLLVQAGEDPPVGSLGGDSRLDAGAQQVAREALWSGGGGLVEIAGATVFVDVVGPPPKLVIVGAVDFAAELSAVAVLAGWRAFVIDPRSRFAAAERFPAAERVIAAWPQEAFAEIGPIDPTTAIAVLTNDPKLDDAALIEAFASDAGYIGAMGSRRAQAKRRERLLAAGVSDAQLDRVAAPIGLDIGALTAAETALSIMSEIVALRRGRNGGRLAESRGRIHEAVS
jgi:xanthine dehydrogenase accessory factor